MQTALAVLSWPIDPYVPERRELSELYLEISAAAVTPSFSESPPLTQALSAAQKTLAGLAEDRSLQAERYWSLLNQAQRIRLTLLALRRIRRRLEREPGG